MSQLAQNESAVKEGGEKTSAEIASQISSLTTRVDTIETDYAKQETVSGLSARFETVEKDYATQEKLKLKLDPLEISMTEIEKKLAVVCHMLFRSCSLHAQCTHAARQRKVENNLEMWMK